MLALLVFGSLLSAVTYDDLREQCKRTMHGRQIGLMSEAKYYLIVDRFLTKAEKLNAVALCQKAPESDLVQRYIAAVCNLNVVIFRAKYAGDYEPRYLEYSKQWLRKILVEINQAQEIDAFDVDVEFAKTIKLIEDGNQYYYDRLDIFKKGFLGCERLFSRK